MLTKSMRTFTIIWSGQLLSLLGTAMTRFALIIWLFERTGKATDIALLSFFAFMPLVIISPFAGVWVDRLDRRRVMIAADFGAGLMTTILLLLLAAGHLQVWHLFAAQAVTGTLEAFQLPAFNAATSILIPKAQYARASGMRSLAQYGTDVGAPILAGTLLPFIHLQGIMLIDIATLLAAIVALIMVRFPATPQPAEAKRSLGFWQEMSIGFRYIFARRGLMGLMFLFAGINFFAALTYLGILPAMVLARTGGDEVALAWVQASLGAGGVAGGIFISVRGIPMKKIHAICAGAAISFLSGDLLLAAGRDVPVWVVGAFVSAAFIPFIIGGDRAIWQAKVDPALQGRVFGSLATFRLAAMPLAYLIAGPLADNLFEPALAVDGAWVGIFGGIVGTGPGAGMGVMFLFTGVLGGMMSLSGYLFPDVREVEQRLPDHQHGPS
jgi:MFS family permease